jgi:DNA-binding MarR family transcriptional regulator
MTTTALVKTDAGYELVSGIMATADTFLRESQRLFRPHGLTGAQFNLLTVVAESAGGLSQRELSDQLVVDRSNVTGLLDRMEKAGWVRRTDHPEDRRVYRIVLTAPGRKLWERVTPRYLEVVRQVTRGIPDRQMREMVTTLRLLENAASAWQLPSE